MSGTFMDGGGHDHGGHGVHGGHGGDGIFCDASDQSQHHGVFQHSTSNGGEGFLSSLLGGNHNHGHNFLSHLLGLDHDSHHGHLHGDAAAAQNPDGQPSQSPIWSQALQGIKLTDIFQGINISANTWLAVMFIGFISWLFVIYWIRHHEPFADAVVGTGAAQSATAAYDRKMMAHINDAFPLRTSREMGSIYVPSPKAIGKNEPDAAQAAEAPIPPSSRFGTAGPINYSTIQGPAFAPAPSPNVSIAAGANAFYRDVVGNSTAVNVPIYQQGGGARLKTIVGR